MTVSEVMKTCKNQRCCPLGLALMERELGVTAYPDPKVAAGLLSIPYGDAAVIAAYWDESLDDFKHRSAQLAVESGVF